MKFKLILFLTFISSCWASESFLQGTITLADSPALSIREDFASQCCACLCSLKPKHVEVSVTYRLYDDPGEIPCKLPLTIFIKVEDGVAKFKSSNETVTIGTGNDLCRLTLDISFGMGNNSSLQEEYDLLRNGI